MRYSLLLPLIFLGLAGCVVDRTPAPTTTTYVTPVPTTTYVSPGTTTVYRTAVRAREKPRHSGATLVDLADMGVAWRIAVTAPCTGTVAGVAEACFDERPRID